MRILVRATNWVGDVVMNLPALRAIIEHYPGAEVRVLVRPQLAPIFELVDGVAGVMPYVGVHPRGSIERGHLTFWKAVRAIRQLRFQKTFLFQNAFEAALLAFMARIPERIGYATDGRALLLTTAVPITPDAKRLHHVQYYLNMLKAVGVAIEGEATPSLTLPDEVLQRGKQLTAEVLGSPASGPYLAICPGASFGPAKRWFPDRFAKVIDLVWVEHNMPSVLLGSAAESPLTAQIAAMASGKCIDLGGKTSLVEAAGVLARAQVVLSNDSGLMHLAAAAGAPVVAIFTSTNPAATGPLGEKHAIITSGVRCAPCLKRECRTHSYDCMLAITVEAVCEAIGRTIKRRREL
ncbi:MAG TPA: lipopolysaccharide heptosyltransferase II [bacterium]|nr:lipopolysaccharide heptosyltransferase II [bacterium]